MKTFTPDIFKLIDAICDAYDHKGYLPIADDPTTPNNERTTFCNKAVDHVASLLGYSLFGGLMANEIVLAMRQSPDWARTEISFAQGWANKGNLVIAGFIEEPHGHVVVVRPGVESFSVKWDCAVPQCLNIGADFTISRSLNFAFKDKPEVFMLVG